MPRDTIFGQVTTDLSSVIGAFDRWLAAILCIVVALAVIIVFVNRPIMISTVITALICVAVSAIALELLRRPPSETEPTDLDPSTEPLSIDSTG